jgi:anaerobic magnesium-protoporphyrin IX monomethyl ester cyclase
MRVVTRYAMRICLATRHADAEFTPLALLYLKAHLVMYGGVAAGDVTIVEFGPAADAASIARTLAEAEPDVVGLSCYVWNITVLHAVVRRLKAARPQVKIVLGGPEVGPVAAAVLAAHPCIDAIVRSEGEVPFSDLVNCWRHQGQLADVAGITLRDGDRVVENADAAILKDVNHVASPHFADYVDYQGRVICLETQRGCVFRCNFCFYNKDLSIRNRRFDLDRVKAEILFWLQRDVRQIYLMDPVFNLNAARAKEICRFIAEHNDRHVPFHTEVWAEFVDDEMARLFAAANFEFIEVGLQTTDSAVLDGVERRLRMQPFLDGIAHLKRHKLTFELQLISGLPGETPASFRTSLNFAASLDPPNLFVYELMILPGTELARKAEDLHITFDPEPPYHVRSHATMSASDIEYFRTVAREAGRVGDSRTLRLLGREPGATFADVLDAWVAWQQQMPADAAFKDRFTRFVRHYCDTHGIPSAFYQRFAASELERDDAPAAFVTADRRVDRIVAGAE